MFEIINIFIYGLFLFVLFLFPLCFSFVNRYVNIKNLNFFDIICLNVLLQFSLYLVFSFFVADISNIIRLIFFFSLILIFFNYKNFQFEKKYNLILSIILFNVIFFSINTHLSSNPRLSWDGVAHWFWKTQNFYYGFGLDNFKNLPNSMYPHLGTYLWSNFWKISLMDYEYFGRFFYSFIFLLIIFSTALSIRSKYIFTIILFLVFLTYEPYVLGGYQEYLLFFLIAVIGKLFFLFDRKLIDKKIFILFFFLSMNLLLWSKQEGIFYLILLLLTFTISINFKIKEKIIIFLSLLFIIILHIYIEYYFKGSKSFHEPIVNNFEKLKDIKLFIFSAMYITEGLMIGFIKRPIILICIFSYIFLKFYRKKNFSTYDFFLVFFIINILFIFSIYIHTHHGLESILPHTLGRLLIHTSGFYLISIIYLFNFFNKKNAIKKEAL
jgi:hypothetical protein